MLTIKQWYLRFLENDKKNIGELLLWVVLFFLSLVYGFVVATRNRLYDAHILPHYVPRKNVISVGNLSWGGTGKTSTVIFLSAALGKLGPVAAVTKGYAKDEFLLLKDAVKDVYDAKDRVSLIKQLEGSYNLFILDDGFQYRRLRRDIDIVIMTAKEFTKDAYLIPAYAFREPASSLKRADIVILTYSGQINELDQLKRTLFSINPRLMVYTADYAPKRLLNQKKEPVTMSALRGKPVGALTAIGNPQGFISLLTSCNIVCRQTLCYPDHYEFTSQEIKRIEQKLKGKHITDVIITAKDFYHIDFSHSSLNYFVLEVELKIHEEQRLIKDIVTMLANKSTGAVSIPNF